MEENMEPDQFDMMDENELRRELRETLKRLDFIERRFRHYHVNSQDGTDVCKECGLDLRDEIHCRA